MSDCEQEARKLYIAEHANPIRHMLSVFFLRFLSSLVGVSQVA